LKRPMSESKVRNQMIPTPETQDDPNPLKSR
jgi:hypothetical protein